MDKKIDKDKIEKLDDFLDFIKLNVTNIFQIWEAHGQKTPFIAKRVTWSNFLVIVDKVEPNGKGYGVAYGRLYDTRYKTFKPYGKIANAGTYSWVYKDKIDRFSSISIY